VKILRFVFFENLVLRFTQPAAWPAAEQLVSIYTIHRAVQNYLKITSQYYAFYIVLLGSINFVSRVLNLV
jgi:hypothetical protein